MVEREMEREGLVGMKRERETEVDLSGFHTHSLKLIHTERYCVRLLSTASD